MPIRTGRRLRTWLTLTAIVGAAPAATGQPAAVEKTNSQKIYMHYMPWFDTPAVLGGSTWGYHWKMQSRNPNNVDSQGRRDIASHYYPLIGTYDSRDPHVVEYHLLLMKLAGVDGVMIDWYGQAGTNGDIGRLLTNSNALVDQVDDFGLQFGVVVEDRFTSTVANAQTNFAYLRDNYYSKPEYIRVGAGDDPLTLVFGPITFQSPAQWAQILPSAGEDVALLPLWYEKNDAGANADGEYAWIYQDASRTHLQHQRDFAMFRAPTLSLAGGVAYPGFDDFYQEGGTSTVIGFEIPHNDGQTLADTLALAGEKQAALDFVQLATFNDFGEGTMFEPTVETGFAYLEQVQQFAGVPYDGDDLQLVYRLFRLRKEFADDAATQAQLTAASAKIAALQLDDARTLLDGVARFGDVNRDGTVDGADVLRWQSELGLTGLYPLAEHAADVNADGVVDAQDLELIRGDFNPPEPGPAAPLPESGSGWAMAAILRRRTRTARG